MHPHTHTHRHTKALLPLIRLEETVFPEKNPKSISHMTSCAGLFSHFPSFSFIIMLQQVTLLGLFNPTDLLQLVCLPGTDSCGGPQLICVMWSLRNRLP